MKKEYDFSNAEHGRFFRGSKPFRIVATASTIIFTSEHDYDSKDDCMAAISLVRRRRRSFGGPLTGPQS